jgi:hypothetical protein
VKLEITEEDHRRIDAAVAAHDPTDWLITSRIRLFSEADAEFYADLTRLELRAAAASALVADALGGAISELRGTVDIHDLREIECHIREMLEPDEEDRERHLQVIAGASDDATDEEANRLFDAARDTVRKETV